jgi:hypothetical protein
MSADVLTAPQSITVEELERLWGGPLTPRLAAHVQKLNLKYRRLSPKERDAGLLKILNAIHDPPVAAGQHRLQQWEHGWQENLSALEKNENPDAVVPRYFGKHALVRWQGDLAVPLTPKFEYHILTVLVEWVLETWLADVGTICEFGCGPGYHLVRAGALFPDKQLLGLDWTQASQEILKKLVETGAASHLQGRRFDFFAPDSTLELGPGTGVYSVAALEQVGENHEALIQYWLAKKPRVCVHLEPIDELLDGERLLDRLSVMCAHKRNYLRGFLPRLRDLERQGRLKILRERRTWTGSFFIEGHSLVVWKPL